MLHIKLLRDDSQHIAQNLADRHELATNSYIYTQMIDDMDFNCSDIIEGVSIEAKGREIFEHVLRVASGEHSKSETLGYGDAEFVPWTIGSTM